MKRTAARYSTEHGGRRRHRLIWAAAGVAFYNGTGGLLEALGNGQSSVVYEICFKLLGPVGAVIAMIGVIACPISSADTAYRSARLTLADWFKIDQKPIKNRLALTVPLLAVGAVLTQVDVQVVWRYFSWSNQTLAMIACGPQAYICSAENASTGSPPFRPPSCRLYPVPIS